MFVVIVKEVLPHLHISAEICIYNPSTIAEGALRNLEICTWQFYY